MRNVWQVIKSSASDAVRSFFSPLLRLIARRGPPPPTDAPGSISAHDFEVPLRDAVLRRLEVWGPLLVMVLAGLAMLAALWWLSTK
jgi:hypothetical protein